jgi:hypothetical protein
VRLLRRREGRELRASMPSGPGMHDCGLADHLCPCRADSSGLATVSRGERWRSVISAALWAVIEYFVGLGYDEELATEIRRIRAGDCHYPACLIKDANTGQMICDEGRNCQN